MKENKDYIFGIHSVAEAIRSGKTIDKLLIKRGLKGEQFNELNEIIKEANITVQLVPIEKLNRITRKAHQGVIAYVSPIPFQRIEDILPGLYEEGKTPFLLILDRVSDVRNFGAIVRTAECAGVDAVIIPEKGAAQISGDAMKTSAGALNVMPICRERHLESTVRFLQDSGLKLIAATEKAETAYDEVDMKIPLAIVVGSEGDGIEGILLKKSDHLVKIPILGDIESLNVGVAASVMMYEVVRQRK